MRNPMRWVVGSAAVLTVAAAAACTTGEQSAGPAPAPPAPAAKTPFLGDVPVLGTSFEAQPAAERLRRDAAAPMNTEAYAPVEEKGFRRVPDEPVSTFSIDVDTASYANVRRFLNDGRLPPPGAVRIEELVNYFLTADLAPSDGNPFAIHAEAAACPWALDHRLVRVALKARAAGTAERRGANLVFLVDVSGSMNDPRKLPLLQQCLKLLVEQMQPDDRVAMVAYAGAAGLVLAPTTGDRKPTIVDAIDALRAGGSTNGGAGIQLAYDTARQGFVAGGVNRVVLCTDGDFNVGVSSRSELDTMIREQAKSGVFLSVLGFGTGNLKDDAMETLADRGNGNYSYIDSLAEGRKVLVEQAGGTLMTVAKDVKIQIEFNPVEVAGWRLVGYENRLLAREDFKDDAKDAGEIGAGHAVTAFYEVVPAGRTVPGADVTPLKYQEPPVTTYAARSGELMTVRVRFKEPEGSASREIERTVADSRASYAQASPDFKFQASVVAFSMLLRRSQWKGTASWDGVIELAGEGLGADPGGYRHEFVSLANKARALTPQAK